MPAISGFIPARAPFDFARSLQFIDVFSPCAGEQRVADGVLAKAVQLGDRAVGLQLSAAEQGVRYTLHADGPIDPQLEAAARDRITHYLSLDDDLGDFYAKAGADPAMAGALRRWRGMHHVKFISPFEIAVWSILGQRTPIAHARRIKDALTRRYGRPVSFAGETHFAFPTARDLGAVPESELLELLKVPRRVRFVRAVIEAFGGVDEHFLRTGDFEAVQGWLREIDGIGEWSCAFILFRGLGRAEQMPFSRPMELAARRAYGPKPKDELRRICSSYGAHQGYWALYLRA